MNQATDPLEVEKLLSADERRPMGRDRFEFEAQRRRVSVEEHAAFRESLAADPYDDEHEFGVDLLLAERPPQRRSNEATRRVLDILDQLERRDG